MKLPNLLANCAAASALAAALSGCGGGGSTSGAAVVPTETPQTAAQALAPSKPGELLAFVKDKLRERQKQRLIDPSFGLPELLFVAITTNTVTSAAAAVAVSGTTVQEQGVDEPDLLKTDGSTLVALTTTGVPQLQLHRRLADGKIQAASTLALPSDSIDVAHGMFFVPDAAGVAVISESYGKQITSLRPCEIAVICITPGLSQASVDLRWVNVANAAAPALAQRVSIDGRLVGSRQIGNALVLVTTHAPVLAVDALPSTATDAEREALLAKLSAADLLPSVSVNGGPAQALLAETECYLQARNVSLAIEITTITVFDLKSPTLARSSRCFAGGSEALYMSTSSIYLATTRYAAVTSGGLIRFPATASTDVHKFSLNGLAAVYRGSAEVPGHLGWDAQKKPYRMGEFQGDLRILTFTGQVGWVLLSDTAATTAPSPATLSILRERSSDQTLQVIGQLPNASRPEPLGLPGEQVYAVRLLGDRGYVVTFRQTDPLYVLDLSNPTAPRTVGELKMPGFSDYLFPIDGGLLLGVGRDATTEGRLGGLKLALFDVLDPTKPKELSSQILGERGSSTALDYSSHGINMLMRGNVLRVALPASLRQGNNFVQGLQRFEVDTRARKLQARPAIPAVSAASAFGDVSGERSVQIADQIYYLSQGRLTVSDW